MIEKVLEDSSKVNESVDATLPGSDIIVESSSGNETEIKEEIQSGTSGASVPSDQIKEFHDLILRARNDRKSLKQPRDVLVVENYEATSNKRQKRVMDDGIEARILGDHGQITMPIEQAERLYEIFVANRQQSAESEQRIADLEGELIYR